MLIDNCHIHIALTLLYTDINCNLFFRTIMHIL